MSQEISIDTSELDRFLRNVGALTVQKTIEGSIRKGILLLEREAKIRTPVDTGLLRNSYETNFRPLEGQLRNFREYAPYVEAKRHFFQDAFSQTETKVRDIVRTDLENLISSLTS